MMLGAGAVGASLATPAFAATPSVLKGAGNFRSLSLVNNRTGEWVKTVYWIDGAYVPEALESINFLMRDWREELVVDIDTRVLDILSHCHQRLDCNEPFEVVSGYRSPKTNALLRRRSRGVARNSYHMKGMAVDIKLRSRSVQQIALAGRTLNAGGVGRYSRAQFVHFDSGPVRTWGR